LSQIVIFPKDYVFHFSMAIPPIILCFGLASLFGSGLIFGTGVVYGMMALGKK